MKRKVFHRYYLQLLSSLCYSAKDGMDFCSSVNNDQLHVSITGSADIHQVKGKAMVETFNVLWFNFYNSSDICMISDLRKMVVVL